MERLIYCTFGVAVMWISGVSVVMLTRWLNEAMLLAVLWRVLP